jgi:hypothetical protein
MENAGWSVSGGASRVQHAGWSVSDGASRIMEHEKNVKAKKEIRKRDKSEK